jgi:hypothetical protein
MIQVEMDNQVVLEVEDLHKQQDLVEQETHLPLLRLKVQMEQLVSTHHLILEVAVAVEQP